MKPKSVHAIVGDDEYDVGRSWLRLLVDGERPAVAVAESVGSAARPIEGSSVSRIAREINELHRVGFEIVKELERR